nr:DUF4055 domain-containing protein [Variovorax paradoxus]
MALKVQDQSSEVLAMAANWPIVEALLGGTAAMRVAGPAFLPQWPAEETKSYKARLATATLFQALERTLSVMSGKPFSKQLTLGKDVPKKIAKWCDDADQQGNSLHSFCADLMGEAMGFGLCGVLVDYPQVGGAARTQQDEKKLGARPYLVFIRHDQILGWKSEVAGGVTRLTQLRIAEQHEVEDGLYGVVYKKRVRVLSPGAFEVWEEGAKPDDPWILVVPPTATTLDQIPFVPFYGKKKGFMCGVSPLLNLAFLNVKHWQSQSDQDTIMHVARVPVLAMIGVDAPSPDGTGGTQLEVGAAAVVRLPPDADMKYVEHTGAAIEAGEKSLEKLEDQMVTTGAELLVIKAGEQKSATQSNNDAEGNKCDLLRITETFEDSLDQVLQLMAKWVKEAEGGHASLFKDFGAATLTDASAQLILLLRAAGLITGETTLREQQRRGMLAADLDPKAELAAAKLDPPPVPLPVASAPAPA